MSAISPFKERAPWFGADLQTLRNSLYRAPAELPGGERLLLSMKDGDRLAARLDRPMQSTRPTVVLVHGLTGTEASRPIVMAARRLVREAWTVVRLNLRGSAVSRPTSAGRYHAGRTEDLAQALQHLPAELARNGFVLIGHSLGGNLVLKFLGEGAHNLPVRAAVAVSAPIDLEATCQRMMAPRNGFYHHYMLQAMKREALAPGANLTTAERDAVASARSVFEFDDAFVAPHFGYRDAADYYDANSAKNFLSAIATPTLLIQALDDPWIPVACYRAVDWSATPAIETAFTSGGGHLGFHGVGSAIPWHDRMSVCWLAQKVLL